MIFILRIFVKTVRDGWLPVPLRPGAAKHIEFGMAELVVMVILTFSRFCWLKKDMSSGWNRISLSFLNKYTLVYKVVCPTELLKMIE